MTVGWFQADNRDCETNAQVEVWIQADKADSNRYDYATKEKYYEGYMYFLLFSFYNIIIANFLYKVFVYTL